MDRNSGWIFQLYKIILTGFYLTRIAFGDDESTVLLADPPFTIEEYLYFEITKPDSLAYSYRARLATDFGTNFEKPLKDVELVLGEPIEGCSPLTSNGRNSVIMLLRGQCSFLTKAYNAQRAGALAVLIADYNESNDEYLIDMVDDKTNRMISIPAVFVMGKDGAMIRHELENMNLSSAIISIPVNMTGVPLNKANQPPWTLW